MDIRFFGLPTETVTQLRATRRDAYGLPMETDRSPGAGIPCRHCLSCTPEGRDFLILAHRPFETLNAYTETGPIFLCADDCAAPAPSDAVPPMLAAPAYLLRGYTADEHIVYGTGQVTPTPDIPGYARSLLSDPQIGFVDIRSASNTCFQCRVRRA